MRPILVFPQKRVQPRTYSRVLVDYSTRSALFGRSPSTTQPSTTQPNRCVRKWDATTSGGSHQGKASLSIYCFVGSALSVAKRLRFSAPKTPLFLLPNAEDSVLQMIKGAVEEIETVDNVAGAMLCGSKVILSQA